MDTARRISFLTLVREQTELINALAELAGNVCFLSSLRWAHPETHCYRNLGSL